MRNLILIAFDGHIGCSEIGRKVAFYPLDDIEIRRTPWDDELQVGRFQYPCISLAVVQKSLYRRPLIFR